MFQISQEQYRRLKGQVCVDVRCESSDLSGGEYYRKFPDKNSKDLMTVVTCETCGLEILVSYSGTINMVYQIIGYKGYK